MKRGRIKLSSLLIFLLAIVFLFSSLTSASLLQTSVNPTAGETGKYQIYNFTVKNTGSPAGTNFTQIEIIADSSVNIESKGTGTSATGMYAYSSSSTKQTLSWNNSAGLVANGTTEYFWINASLTKYAYYNFTVASLNYPGGATNQTIITILSNDTISPSINFITPPTPSNNANLNQTYIPIKVSASDSGSGLANITIYLYNSTGSLIKKEANSTSPFFYNFTGLNRTTYKTAAIAWDVAGNYKLTPTLTLNLGEPSASCTNSNWSCSWGSCINGTKIQKCVDLSGCNSTVWNNQTTSCDSSSSGCTPHLNCTLWLPACGNGITQQTKTCTDLNNCTSPAVTTTTRNCTVAPKINESQIKAASSFHLNVSPSVMAFSGVLILIVVVIIVVILFLRKMRRS